MLTSLYPSWWALFSISKHIQNYRPMMFFRPQDCSKHVFFNAFEISQTEGTNSKMWSSLMHRHPGTELSQHRQILLLTEQGKNQKKRTPNNIWPKHSRETHLFLPAWRYTCKNLNFQVVCTLPAKFSEILISFIGTFLVPKYCLSLEKMIRTAKERPKTWPPVTRNLISTDLLE